ncbi:MAG: N-methyl-L-tryptophan oxidase [Chthoniobacterales bacterium]
MDAKSVVAKLCGLTDGRKMRYEVAVVGLGTMGSATVAECARRGVSVIGLEQFERGHELGSSSGRTRMIRKAYFEDPAYVGLLLRSYDLWHELEKESGQCLLRMTGLLMVGREDSEIIRGAKRAAREHGLPLDALTAQDIRTRYTTLKIQDDEVGVYEPDGGVLDPERSIEAFLRVAQTGGAHLRFNTAMESWETTAAGFTVHLAGGEVVQSRALVLSLGPWSGVLMGQLGVALSVQRNIQAWFRPTASAYGAPHFPPFLLDRAGWPAALYGFPDFGDGVKAAFHSHGVVSAPSLLDRTIDFERDIAPIRAAMDTWMPGAAGEFQMAKACMYSLTPDCHFVIDRHPQHTRLVLCGGFSGHGFKFAPLVGEIATDLALERASRHDLDFLSLKRFAAPDSRRVSIT